jgi:hypothetical protein
VAGNGTSGITMYIDGALTSAVFEADETAPTLHKGGIDPSKPHNLTVFPGNKSMAETFFSLDYLVFITPDNL